MKRAILIATGTVGGLGAVLAITPPTFTSTESSSMALPGTAVDPVAATECCKFCGGCAKCANEKWSNKESQRP
jgi:hypothetical protein